MNGIRHCFVFPCEQIERKVSLPNINGIENADQTDIKRQDSSFFKPNSNEFAREKNYWKDGWKGSDESSAFDATSDKKQPNFSVKQQEDGGILIEPGQIPSGI